MLVKPLNRGLDRLHRSLVSKRVSLSGYREPGIYEGRGEDSAWSDVGEAGRPLVQVVVSCTSPVRLDEPGCANLIRD